MRLSTFKKILSELDILKFQLPDGHFVPPHFHITEVGNVTRNYICLLYTSDAADD